MVRRLKGVCRVPVEQGWQVPAARQRGHLVRVASGNSVSPPSGTSRPARAKWPTAHRHAPHTGTRSCHQRVAVTSTFTIRPRRLQLVGIDLPCGDQGSAQFLCGMVEFRAGRALADRGQEAAGVLTDVGVPPRVGAGAGDEQGGDLCGCGLVGVVRCSFGDVIGIAQGGGVAGGGEGEVEPGRVVDAGECEGACVGQGAFRETGGQGGTPQFYRGLGDGGGGGAGGAMGEEFQQAGGGGCSSFCGGEFGEERGGVAEEARVAQECGCYVGYGFRRGAGAQSVQEFGAVEVGEQRWVGGAPAQPCGGGGGGVVGR